jgi:RNA polymerase sigma factor (sigma-70 family)
MASERARIDEIYRRYGDVVLRRARQILGNDHDAREALQQLFMSLLSDPHQFAGRSSITSWLYSATTHLCLNTIRNRKTRLRLAEAHVGADRDVEPARADRIAQVRQLLALLPTELAEVVVYYYVDEMTQDEIADVLGCSRRQVGYLIERAHGLVKDMVA